MTPIRAASGMASFLSPTVCPRFHNRKVLRSRNRNKFNLKGGGKNPAQQEMEGLWFLVFKKDYSTRAARSYSFYSPEKSPTFDCLCLGSITR